ncbi:MAG TPA: oligosaccharide repeat unit polymerase [Methanothermococcus okinawensis]|uniref:Oligosaccharide repeat unit polymerase n=1 Tax=Methanothermococcus okinawensis TaxID=155863 RepID=A0A833E217_9EURY|nr:oligosaccharide repeat unit polymerase [Methanococcaceae archaeon]HIP84787.1 oligosaccharide repeat unit polymerase [Methanothermococcus okinawensis]HIP91249.1 oligosaccharide repeat unit polymerase [Methanothermococcus okinawensis]
MVVIKKIDITHPVFIVILGHLAILLLAIPYYSSLGYEKLIKIFLIIAIFILFYSIPFFIGDKIFEKIGNTSLRFLLPALFGTVLFLLIFYGVFTVTKSYLTSILYSILVLIVANLYVLYNFLKEGVVRNPPVVLEVLKYIEDIIFAVGVLSFIALTVKYNTIPILDYRVRMAISKDPLRLISTGALVYGGMGNPLYFILAFILILLLGYKAGILILIISFLLYNYYLKRISLKGIVISILGLIVLLAVMAKIILLSSGQQWSVGVLEILSYRAYFDIKVLEKIVDYPTPTLGKILLNPEGEKLIGELLFGYSHNFTSTMFGPVYLDFNIYGLLFATLLGLFSRFIYKGDKRIYCIYAAILLSMCEIGINYGFLIVTFTMLYVNALLNLKEEFIKLLPLKDRN